jgi:signal transduction histidine kinase
LFQKFVTGKSTGTGIGLYSAKLIAEAHGWELIYEPLPGKTCFLIKILDKENN